MILERQLLRLLQELEVSMPSNKVHRELEYHARFIDKGVPTKRLLYVTNLPKLFHQSYSLFAQVFLYLKMFLVHEEQTSLHDKHC